MVLLMLGCATEEPRYGTYDPGPCADNLLEIDPQEPTVLDGGREDYGRLGYGRNELLMLLPDWDQPVVTTATTTLLTDGYAQVGQWSSDVSCVPRITNHYGQPQALLACPDGVYELLPDQEPELMDVDHAFYQAWDDDYDGDGVDDLVDYVDYDRVDIWYGHGGDAQVTMPDTIWYIGEGDWTGDGQVDQAYVLGGTDLGVLVGGHDLSGVVDGAAHLVMAPTGAYDKVTHAGDMDGDGYGDLMVGDGVTTKLLPGGADLDGLGQPLFTLISRTAGVEPMGWSDVDDDAVSDPIVGTSSGDGETQDVYALRYCEDGGVLQLQDVAVLMADDVAAPLEEAIPVDLDADRVLEVLVDGYFILRVYEL